MRQLHRYLAKYGPEAGAKLYHLLQSQAAHAGVSARLRRKIETLKNPVGAAAESNPAPLPLFPDVDAERAV